jgi:hypothetical protein
MLINVSFKSDDLILFKCTITAVVVVGLSTDGATLLLHLL